MASTALSVSVTRSEASYGVNELTLQSVRRGTRFLQFFFVSIVDGLAEVIMSPAFLANSTRKSWIS